jgi:hypothetical protein
MSTYQPAHVEAVHGHAYAVKAPGQHTQPMPAVTLKPEARQYEQPCEFGCPVRPQVPGGDPRALLYAGPGIAIRNWEAKVREGAWVDIPGEFDAAHARVHMPAIKVNRHIRRDLSNGVHHLGAMFAAHPDWRTDAEVAEALRKAEVQLQYQLDRMRREAGTGVAP